MKIKNELQYTISMYCLFDPNKLGFIVYNRDSTQQSSTTIAQGIDLMWYFANITK